MSSGFSLRPGSIAALSLILVSCASRQPAVYVPPRLDLARYESVGIIEFRGIEAPPLGGTATAEFLSAVHAAQPGTPVLELGDPEAALPGAASGRIDAAAIRKLAAREGVEAIWVGELVESLEQPRFALNALHGSASASARRKAHLTVRLFDGRSGATVWSASSERTIPVMAIDGSLRGGPNVRTTPSDEARAILVRDLVGDVTCDLRPTWARP